MKINSLNLANYRGFNQIKLEFEKDLNVIAGVNGIGKSGVLQTLATILSHTLKEITPSRDKEIQFTNEDIREGQHSLSVSSTLSTLDYGFDITIHNAEINTETIKNAEDRLKQIRIELSESDTDDDTEKELLEEKRYLLELIKKQKPVSDIHIRGAVSAQATHSASNIKRKELLIKNDLHKRENQPVAILFSTDRQIIREMRKLQKPTPLKMQVAYKDALKSRPLDMGHFVHWFRVQEHLQNRRIIDNLRNVISDFIPEITELRIKEIPAPRFEVLKNGSSLSLHQLSDGERGLITMIFDISRRLTIANPGLDDPITDGEGIILIDEVELHLHPLWQREVLKRFTETFRNCQFVATTHSPLVLGEVEARCVRFLERDDEGKIICTVPHIAYGLDANRILEELMGARVRTKKINDQLKKLFEQIDNEDFNAARQGINEVREKLGEHDPELTRASSLIKFLEGNA